MEIRRLTEADVDDALGLSRQAGWNQVGTDWRRLLSLTPERCYAGWVDGRLVATTTAMTYGDELSWIGMVLVDEEHRRQGYGTRILTHALEQTRPDVTDGVGLDATDQGRPLYRQHGFEDVRPITRLCGTIRRDGEGEDVETVAEDRTASIAAIDEAACGTDRTDLLERLLSEPETVCYVTTDDVSSGYAILRPGREHWQLGPIVAADVDALGHLLDAAGARLNGDTIIVDSLAEGPAADVLAASGLQPQRRLTRMTAPAAAPLLTGEAVVAAAGLELG